MISVSPSGRVSGRWGNRTHPTPFVGRLVSNQCPEPVRLPSEKVEGRVSRVESRKKQATSRTLRLWTLRSGPWTSGSGPDGSRTHHTDLARVSRPQRHAGPRFGRSVRESNPILVLTKDACCRNTYRPSVPSDPGWNRTIDFLVVTQVSLPLDHGIVSSVTEAGVEPARSRASRTRRFASLRTRPWRVRVSHPAGEAHEAPLSAGPPAVAGPGNDPGTPAS